MIEEAAVLGGEHRLDQVVGHLVERHGVALLDAALADLVAVAVEEGDGEVALWRASRRAVSPGRRGAPAPSISTAPPVPSVSAVAEDLDHRPPEAR